MAGMKLTMPSRSLGADVQSDNDNLATRQHLLRWLGLFGAIVVLLVTTTSALLRVSAAGLGCDDWPACYGEAATGATERGATRPSAARFIHRISASLAGAAVLGIGLIALTHPRRFRREVVTFGALAVLTLGLALLGRATPGASVPAVAMGNALGGMLLASLLFNVALGARPAAPRRQIGSAVLSWLALGLMFATMGLGVLTSASFSGLACTGLPLCTDTGFPGPWSAADLNPWRDAAGSPSIHMAHRAATVALAAAVIALAWSAGSLGAAGRRMRYILLTLLSVQVLLGVALVRFSLPLPLAVVHNLGAAALLLALVAAHHLVARPAGASNPGTTL